jgi:hypothetical protein
MTTKGPRSTLPAAVVATILGRVPTNVLLELTDKTSGVLLANQDQKLTLADLRALILNLSKKSLLTKDSGSQTTDLTAGKPVQFDTVAGDHALAGYSVTIPAGSKALLLGTVSGELATSGVYFNLRWYNVTVPGYIGQASNSFGTTWPSNNVFQPIACARVVTTVDTEFQLRIESVTGTINSFYNLFASVDSSANV